MGMSSLGFTDWMSGTERLRTNPASRPDKRRERLVGIHLSTHRICMMEQATCSLYTPLISLLRRVEVLSSNVFGYSDVLPPRHGPEQESKCSEDIGSLSALRRDPAPHQKCL